MNPSQMPRDYLYMSDLMQQAGITTSGDLAFGSLGVDMELKLAQDFSNSSLLGQFGLFQRYMVRYLRESMVIKPSKKH